MKENMGCDVRYVLKRILTGTSGVLLAGAAYSSSAQEAIKLFDARPVTETGAPTRAEEADALGFKTVRLVFRRGDTAVIAGSADGRSPIVIDNFLSINSIDNNACLGVPGQVFEDACFGPLLVDLPFEAGAAINEVLAPVPPIDVTRFMPISTDERPRTVLFMLRDHGVIAGNTDLYLVTRSATPAPPPPEENLPDLLPESNCAQGAREVVVRNQGTVGSGPTSASASLQLVQIDPDTGEDTVTTIRPTASTPNIPALAPGETTPQPVARFSTEACPRFPTSNEQFRRLTMTVDRVATTRECREHRDPAGNLVPKEGRVCEVDERNNAPPANEAIVPCGT